MPSELYWIDIATTPRLAIMARPRAGDWLDDEIAHWSRSGVKIVVSLLEREEVDDLGLGAEAALCAQHGIEFRSFPIPDRGLPTDTGEAMRFATSVMQADRATAVHCRAGIGRSAIVAAAMLVSRGIDPAQALAAIERARGTRVPDTEMQRDWVMALRPLP